MATSAIEKDIKKCKLLWDEFSPKKSLFDLWDFRFAFYKAYLHKPYFIVLKENEANVGLLPLWYEKEKQKYFWFGSWWQEDNAFWVKKPSYISDLLDLCPSPVCINGITAIAVQEVPEKYKDKFLPDDPKYILDINKIKCFEDYLASLKKDRRKPIKKDLLFIESKNPEIAYNKFEDFEFLIGFSKERFSHKNEDKTDPWFDSSVNDPRRVEAFRNIIKFSGEFYQAKMLTARINKKIAGVDLAVIYNNCYYPLIGGYNTEEFSGIGNYFNMLNIKDAISMKLSRVDVLQSDCGWKHRWYSEVPLYYFEK